MVFINQTEIIGILIGTATETTTGDIFITLLLVMTFLIATAMLFRIDLDWTLILVLPYALVCGSYYSDWIGVLGAMLIYLTFLLVKNWIFK